MALNKFNLPRNPNDYSSKAKIDKELNQALLSEWKYLLWSITTEY